MSAVLRLRNRIPEHGDTRLFIGAENEPALITDMHIKPTLQSTGFGFFWERLPSDHSRSAPAITVGAGGGGADNMCQVG